MPVENGDGPEVEQETDVEYGTFDPYERPLPEDTPAADGTEATSLFDDRFKEPFQGLAYLGALTKSFEWLGHKFVIRTLTQDEELASALLIKEWEGTPGSQRAFVTAMVALCVESVDGQPLPTPISEGNSYAWAYQKFNFVKARWFPTTIDAVYVEYLALEQKAREVVEEMGKASGQEAPTPGSSENSG